MCQILMNISIKQGAQREISGQKHIFSEGPPKKLRWFMLPYEAKELLCYGATTGVQPPFCPTGGWDFLGECRLTILDGKNLLLT